jgi:hypothetical protein
MGQRHRRAVSFPRCIPIAPPCLHDFRLPEIIRPLHSRSQTALPSSSSSMGHDTLTLYVSALYRTGSMRQVRGVSSDLRVSVSCCGHDTVRMSAGRLTGRFRHRRTGRPPARSHHGVLENPLWEDETLSSRCRQGVREQVRRKSRRNPQCFGTPRHLNRRHRTDLFVLSVLARLGWSLALP